MYMLKSMCKDINACIHIYKYMYMYSTSIFNDTYIIFVYTYIAHSNKNRKI